MKKRPFAQARMEPGMNYGPIQERFRWISSIDDPKHARLFALDRSMRDFYQNIAIEEDYHRIAESGNVTWDDHPLQKAIMEMILPKDRVVEFSCGSGHSARHFNKLGCHYVGFDLSPLELARTKRKEKFASYIAGNGYQVPLASSSADFVISLYSLEHLVWPQRYLDEMRRVARVNGHLALAFPDYLKNPRGRPTGSMRFGRSPGGIRDKAEGKRFIDAAQTLFERLVLYRMRVAFLRRCIYQKQQVKFMINTAPLCLVSRYASDNDAIYFASEEEIACYLRQNGCRIVRRSSSVINAHEGNGLVIAEVLQK